MAVELVEITKETVRAVCNLDVSPEQQGNVAPNAVSLAQALFEEHAWYRAIHADGELVGFVQMHLGNTTTPYVWRFMIDVGHQGQGHGRAAMEAVIAECRGRGAEAILLSYVPGPHSPAGFYESLGFIETGVEHGVEREMRLEL